MMNACRTKVVQVASWLGMRQGRTSVLISIVTFTGELGWNWSKGSLGELFARKAALHVGPTALLTPSPLIGRPASRMALGP